MHGREKEILTFEFSLLPSRLPADADGRAARGEDRCDEANDIVGGKSKSK